MKKILILLYLISSFSSVYAITLSDGDICSRLAESFADAKELNGAKRKNFIKAMKYMCLVKNYSLENYEKEIGILSNAIQIFQSIDEAKDELKNALEQRAIRYSYKTYATGYLDKSACWNAIYDYSQLIEFEKKSNYILNRGKLYYDVDKYEKSCTDLKQAAALGEREAKNLIDKYDCY
ncbi:hypothetical protein KLA_17429 [Cellulophaga geojensis KL-A]|uniref:Uncharacterized protein n=1 Tax=Cellulophaga geojensis KL-A TaxID=1328323 RepID=A0ABN0RJ79_9FLAO|nr:hypothetical protein [Cellulophaga geojensis]EWH08870.1 hypothetical protein KLA_17429 [Cellulophaga geojensis KL-A]